MPTKLVLIRHGQTVHNAAGQIAGWTDSPLSLLGQAQARRLAQHVASRYHLEAIYTSPLQRARLTAHRVGEAVGLRPAVSESLKELNFGLVEGLSRAEAASRFPGLWEAADLALESDFAWPGGESTAQFAERVRVALADIIRSHSGSHSRGSIAVVAHGGVIGTYVAEIKERNPRAWVRYVPGNCSVTEVESHAHGLYVTCFDECSFLVDGTPTLARASLAAALPGAGL